MSERPEEGGVPTRWAMAPRVTGQEQSLLGVDSLLLAQLLWNRGVRTAAEAVAFAAPADLDLLGDPASMRGVPEAVERLARAVRLGESIAIYGDYDVDGVAGTGLMLEALRALRAEPLVYLPDRAREGHGLNVEALRHLAAHGAQVVVTVDCGITAGPEIEVAAQLDMDVIVTDHHTVPAELPGAVAVLNPHQEGCQYPFKELAGGGVAYQLARGLLGACLPPAEARQWSLRLADLAALSTVADVVPLRGENRALVALGLAAIRGGARPGLRALCRGAGRRWEDLTARDLGFAVIPRLNAAGRMGDARDALDVLLASDPTEAEKLAQSLEGVNAARRDQMTDLLASVEEDAGRWAAEGAIVIDGPYPIGLAGLLAARLVDRWQVPSVVVQRGEPLCRGSARAPEGLHLVEALEQCASWLLRYGGHARAAGFTLDVANLGHFRKAFVAAVAAAPARPPRERVLRADGALKLRSVGPALADLLERLEPTGEGNPPALFLSRVTIQSAKGFGDGHLRIRVRDGGAVRRAIAFRPSFASPSEGMRVELLYEVSRTLWQGNQEIDLIVRDLRPAAV